MTAKAKGELVCCIMCGRDTRRKNAICSLCAGAPSHEEERGRSGLRYSHFTDSPLRDAKDDEIEPTAAENYHGDSIRDDL